MNNDIMEAAYLQIMGESHIRTCQYHLMLVIRGCIEIHVSSEHFIMPHGNFLLIDPEMDVRLKGDKDNTYIDITIPRSILWRWIPAYEGIFQCNTCELVKKEDDAFRRMIIKFALRYSQDTAEAHLECEILKYQLLLKLTQDYFKFNIPNNYADTDKANEISALYNYITIHYREPITLKCLTGCVHLSESQLSRLIKKYFGMHFSDFLKKYRLERSLTELLYTSTPVTEIALNNGFSSASAYIGAFRKQYSLTPKQYRLNATSGQPPLDGGICPIGWCDIEADIAMDMEADHDNIARDYDFIHIDVQKSRRISQIWKSGINVAAYDNVRNVTRIIEKVQKDIGFRYGRIFFAIPFWNHAGSSDRDLFKREQNRFIQVINDLISNNLIPYIELQCHLEYVEDNDHNYHVNNNIFIRYVKELLEYMKTVFGNQINRWVFDIALHYNSGSHCHEDIDDFIFRFIKCYELIRLYAPEAKIGGPNLFSNADPVLLDRFLIECRSNHKVPDFVSLAIVPYLNTGVKDIYSPDCDYAQHFVRRIREHVDSCIQGVQIPVHISVIAPTLTFRHFLNDSCFQAAFIAKNMVDLIDETNFVCYCQLTDYNFSNNENYKILDGRNGIVSQSEIPKSGYMAFMLMAQLPEYLIHKGTGDLVMCSDDKTYYILLYNYKHLSDTGCLNIKTLITPAETYSVFEDADSKKVTLHLSGVDEGKFEVFSQWVNRDQGSLFDAWVQAGAQDYISNFENQYLRNKVHPGTGYEILTSSDGNLEYTTVLGAHEVRLLEIRKVQ